MPEQVTVPDDRPVAAPQHAPTPTELCDLELLLAGALRPTTGFNDPGSPITLSLPPEVAEVAEQAGAVELVDPEGLPLARVPWPNGTPEPLSAPEYGPFRRLHLPPEVVREKYAGRTFVPVGDALTVEQIDRLRSHGPVALLALVGEGTPALSPVALLRATLVAAELHGDAEVVAVPLATHGNAEVDHELGVRVVSAYAGDDPVVGLTEPEGGLDVPPRSSAALDQREAEYPGPIAEIIDFDQPPRHQQGLVLFFTGLSGSGKSTLARALMDRLLEQGARTVTSLDGDVVRRNLSAGLTFSKADRETNIRRIGWVAAEISRHGGVAVCSPIAPFDETRQQVRRYVEDAGGAFFLVHVATPLEECERRDRKGLYAKARAGEIPEFTGISSPYEEPEDADVRVDTTGRTIEDALGDVLVALRSAGYVDLLANPGDRPGDPDPLKVLFVCTANICRSAYAEILARSMASSARVEFASAGIHGWTDHPLEAEMTKLLPDGVVADSFLSRALDAEMLEDADLVLTAEAVQRSWILAEYPGMARKVFTLGQAAAGVEKLAAQGYAGEELLVQLAQARPAADPSSDITDPFRRGPKAAADAARRIADYLDVVVPALAGGYDRPTE